MLFVSFISWRFIEDVSSRGRMPQMKTLIALFPCLKQVAIFEDHSQYPYVNSGIHYWYPKFKAINGLKNLFQTLLQWAKPAIREPPISIVSKLLWFNLEQCLRRVFIQFVLYCHTLGIVVILTNVINVKGLLENELNNSVGDGKRCLPNFSCYGKTINL